MTGTSLMASSSSTSNIVRSGHDLGWQHYNPRERSERLLCLRR